MRNFLTQAAALAIICLTVPAAAADDLSALSDGGSAVVTAIVDGDTVVLDDGREVRLVGIQAPKLPLGRPAFKKWPFADAAREFAARLMQGGRVTLRYGGRQTDRHGRALAHLVAEDGTWVQGVLLRQGFARVYSFSDNRALVSEMLAIEADARADRRGIWQLDWYAVTPHEDAAGRIGEFALIEGQVADTAVVRGRGFVNFGPDYRVDFTATIAPADLRTFVREGFDISRLEGRRVRVRGWVTSYNGPMIEVTHPEQIEELDR
jgi:endonuclease YncB( thermonuclease family)